MLLCPKRRQFPNSQPHYKEIATLRSVSFWARSFIRSSKKTPRDDRLEIHRKLQGPLKKEIQPSRRNFLKQLCQYTDIILQGSNEKATGELFTLSKIHCCHSVYPQRGSERQIVTQLNAHVVTPVVEAELREICDRIRGTKASRHHLMVFLKKPSSWL